MRKFENIIAQNILLAFSWLIIQKGVLDLVSVAAIILCVFILPGLGWLGLFAKRKKRGFIENFFFVFAVSTLLMLIGTALMAVIRMPFSPAAHFLYLAVIINSGLLLTDKDFSILSGLSRLETQHLIVIITFVLIFVHGYRQAAYTIPALPDNTLTVQQAAYGLKRSLKPYTFSDDGFLTFYFAHPPLMNFYTATTIFLSGHLDELKYYYDYSKMAEHVYTKGPSRAETFTVHTSPKTTLEVAVLEIKGDWVVLNRPLPEIYLSPAFTRFTDKLLTEENIYEIRAYTHGQPLGPQDKNGPITVTGRLMDKTKITKNVYEQIRLRNFHDELYKRFASSPHTLCSRISNLFFVMATLAVMMAAMTHLGLSVIEALFFLVVYISLPEVDLYAFGGSRTAQSGFCLISMVYFYIQKNSRFSFLSGLVSGLSTQKLIILPVAAALHRLVFRKPGFPVLSIINGFGAGLVSFWMYAASIDVKNFYTDHIQTHTVNRFLHINDLGYNQLYPDLLSCWQLFIGNLGWPFFLLAVFSLCLLFKERDRGLSIFSFWFVAGAVLFSLVDWRQTKHFMLIVIPMIFAVAYTWRILKEKQDILAKIAAYSLLAALTVMCFTNIRYLALKSGDMLLTNTGIESHW